MEPGNSSKNDYPDNAGLRVLGPSKHRWPGDEWRGVRTSPLGYEGRLLVSGLESRGSPV